MGTDCSGSGSVTIPLDSEDAAVAAFLAHREYGTLVPGAEDIAQVLAEAFGFDVVDYGTDTSSSADGEPGENVRHVEVYYNGRWGGDLVDMFKVLAEHGIAADLTFSGLSEDSVWKIVARNGTARELSGITYFPGDLDPDEPCVAVTRRDAQTLLALLAGDHVEGLGEVVKKLTDALA